MQTLEHHQIEILRPRTSEIYRYLGLLAIVHELPKTNEYLRRQIETELAESIDTEMGTHGKAMHMSTKGGCLYSHEDINMTASAYQWAAIQRERASSDYRFNWLSDIASCELQEYIDVVKFYETAEVGDALVVVSPFPEEAYDNLSTKHLVEQEGYNPKQKRAFLRVYEARSDALQVHVQSVDSSDLDIWNQVLEPFGATKAMTTPELLAGRFVIEQKTAENIIDEIVQGYDDQLFSRSGTLHTFGRMHGGSTEANTFIWQNPDIIEDTIRELQEINELDSAKANKHAERILYSSKALLNHLFQNPNITIFKQNSEGSVRDMRQSYGAAAAEEGKVFYGCSGSSSALTTATESSINIFTSSFSMKNSLEIHDCVTCPLCKGTGGVRDPKTGTWACPKPKCSGYDEAIITRSKQGVFDEVFSGKNTKKDFGDLLVEFFFGEKMNKR